MWTSGGQIDHLAFGGMRGGGKGGGGQQQQYQPPPPPRAYTDPVSGMTFTDEPGTKLGPGAPTGAKALNDEIAQRKATEKQTSDAALAQTAQDKAAAETKFQGSKQAAYNSAMQNAVRQFQLQGADPSQYMDTDIKPALDAQMNQIQDLDPNPGASFPTTLGSTIANQVLSGKRTQATNQYNSLFSPNYSSSLLQDSAIDPYVSQIVDEQFNPLSSGLTNAQKRGTLNDAGYQAALDALNQRKTAATSSVRSLGTGILNKDRSDLDTLIGQGRTDINNLGFTNTFDPSAYQSKAQSAATQDLSGLGGALRGAVGDTKYADLTDLLNAGGAVQGATQPTAANPIGGTGATPTDDQLSQQKRGLGNTGAF